MQTLGGIKKTDILSAWYETTIISHGFRSPRTNIRLISAINTLEVVISWRELKQNNRYWYSDEAGSITIYFFYFLYLTSKIPQSRKKISKHCPGLQNARQRTDRSRFIRIQGRRGRWSELIREGNGTTVEQFASSTSWQISFLNFLLGKLFHGRISIFFLGYIWCGTVIIIYCIIIYCHLLLLLFILGIYLVCYCHYHLL